MYLSLDFTTEYGGIIYDLQILNLIKNKEKLSEVCKSFYSDFIEKCLNNNQLYCLYSYIENKFFSSETLMIYCLNHYGTIEMELAFCDDVFNFLSYDYYLSKLFNHDENSDIHELIDDITNGYYSDQLDYHLDDKVAYGRIEDISFFIGPFYIEETVEKLMELEKLINERRFLFKLKGLHRKNPPFGGFFLCLFLLN